MYNKIIAVACVLLLLIAALAACGRVPTITDEDGNEYPLVTDEEGNTVVDGNGFLVVYATDDDGDYVTDENGDRQTAIVTFPEAISQKGSVETASYILTAPDGWELDQTGRILHKKTGNAKIEVTNFGALEDGVTLESYTEQQMQAVETLAEQLKTQYDDVTHSVNAVQFSGNDAQLIELRVKDGDAVVQDIGLVYFVANGDLFKVLYTTDAEGYDEAFDFMTEMQTHLQLK